LCSISEEKARVEAAGGTVENDRIEGNLNLSRALGDHQYKANTDLPPEKQMITGFPDISVSV
jgi:serine/threonine protein phosphatase PrpC